MPKIGTTTYPDKFADLMKDHELMSAFAQFARKSKKLQSMMMYCSADMTVKQRYTVFHSPKSSQKLKLSASVSDKITALARESIKENRDTLEKIFMMVQNAYLPKIDAELKGFYASDLFRNVHCKKVTGKKDLGQLLRNASSKLNIKKAKNVEALKAAIEAGLFEGPAKAKTLCKKLSKTGMFGPLGNRDVYSELKKHKFV